MQLAAVVRVRAVDEKTGEPIPEFNVRVQNSRDRQQGDPWGSFSTSYTEQGVNIMGDKKEFTMESLAEGTPLKVTVSAKGFQSTVLPRVLAVRSDKAELIDVPLKKDSPQSYQKIGGTIIKSDGTPVVAAVVKLIVGSVDPVSEGGSKAVTSSETIRVCNTCQHRPMPRESSCSKKCSRTGRGSN